MKTYKVKNYKGNIVESLSKFQNSHKGMKIVEATKNGDNLKIKAEEQRDKIEESAGKKIVYLLRIADEYQDLVAVCSSKEEAKKAASEYHSRYDGYEDDDKIDLIIYEWPFDIVEPEEKQLKSYRA